MGEMNGCRRRRHITYKIHKINLLAKQLHETLEMKQLMNVARSIYRKLGRKRLSLLLVVLLLSSLAVTSTYFFLIRPRSILRACRFRMVSISVDSYDENTVVFKLLMNVSNPDWQAAQMDLATFDMVLTGFSEPLAHGWTENAYSVPPHGSSIITLFFRIQNSPMLSIIFNELINREKVNFTISGSMTSTWLLNIKFPFTLNSALEIPRKPLNMMKIMSIDALPPGTRFRVTIRMDNPMNIPIGISSLAFDVFNESRAYTLDGVLSSSLEIPPLGSANASILIDVKKKGFEWLIGMLMSDEATGLLIQGNASAHILPLQAFLNFNLSKTFMPSRRMEFSLNTTLLDPIEMGEGFVSFKVPIEVKSPIECNVSMISFELYNTSSSYIGFGYSSYDPPLLLSPNQKTWLPISINMTLEAFRHMVVQILLGEKFDLQIKNGLMSILIYETAYDIRFERKMG